MTDAQSTAWWLCGGFGLVSALAAAIAVFFWGIATGRWVGP
jgi:hypothetical protein